METLQICSPDRLRGSRVKKGICLYTLSINYRDHIVKKDAHAHDSFLLQYVGDAGARQLEAEVDPEGPDHNERSGDSQHSPRRHLIHELCYFKHLKKTKNGLLREKTATEINCLMSRGKKLQYNCRKNCNCKCCNILYLQHQGHPDEKHHESIKHAPAVLHIGVVPLCRERTFERS